MAAVHTHIYYFPRRIVPVADRVLDVTQFLAHILTTKLHGDRLGVYASDLNFYFTRVPLALQGGCNVPATPGLTGLHQVLLSALKLATA